MDRRSFLGGVGAVASSAFLSRRALAGTTALAGARSSSPILEPSTLTPFVDPLPLPPLARRSGLRPSPEDRSRMVPFYRMAMKTWHVRVHRELPPTMVWGFENSSLGSFPGPTIEARSGEPVMVEWANELPQKHFLPIDHHLHGAGKDVPDVRSVIHLHGGRTPPAYDGYPEDWYVPGKSATYYYPNGQNATTLFYHDHAMGINRLNVYAGLEGLYILRDAEEEALNLPKGKYEVPLVLCDRFLHRDGSLEYPVSGIPNEPWVPEVFGNAILVNGKLLPYLDVEPRKYRFRILNGSNARFYQLSIALGDRSLSMHGISSDQGLLSVPVEIQSLEIAPAERYDVVVDFSRFRGKRLLLKSHSFEIMQIRVASSGSEDQSSLPQKLRPVERIEERSAVRTRRLTLDEYLSMADQSVGMLLNQTRWGAPITEKPTLGTTEIWEFLNSTEDSHPIHLHLVRFQILDRRPFDASVYLATGEVDFIGDRIQPAAIEMGWKDTARAGSGMLTRIIVPFLGYHGRYVWHCHILEHEDNEMMRPYEVLPEGRKQAGGTQ